METADPGGGKMALYFDDLHAGQRFVSGTHELDVAQITEFAREFDPQPFHLDREAARDTFFRELVASGWQTAAISTRLLVQGGLPIAGGLIGAGTEISWPKPTRPGAILKVESEVVNLKPSRSRPDLGIVTVRSETRDQTGEIVVIMTTKLVVPRRVPGAAREG